MQGRSARYLAGLLLVVTATGCGSERVADAGASEPMAATPIGIGDAHNDILREMGVTWESLQLTQSEYLSLLAESANRALRGNGAAEDVTVEDVSLVFAVARKIDVDYDLHFEDPGRADLTTVLDKWRDNRVITGAEHAQLVELFSAGSLQLAMKWARTTENNTESDLVRQTSEVFMASMEYWSGAGRRSAVVADMLRDGYDDPRSTK